MNCLSGVNQLKNDFEEMKQQSSFISSVNL